MPFLPSRPEFVVFHAAVTAGSLCPFAAAPCPGSAPAAFQHICLGAQVEEGAGFVGAFFEHLAVGNTAWRSCWADQGGRARPRPDRALEEGDDGAVQAHHVVGAAGAHHDAAG